MERTSFLQEDHTRELTSILVAYVQHSMSEKRLLDVLEGRTLTLLRHCFVPVLQGHVLC